MSKNSKEQYIKRLQMCMKTYDYKDEQKDVKGKVRKSMAIGCGSGYSLHTLE